MEHSQSFSPVKSSEPPKKKGQCKIVRASRRLRKLLLDPHGPDIPIFLFFQYLLDPLHAEGRERLQSCYGLSRIALSVSTEMCHFLAEKNETTLCHREMCSGNPPANLGRLFEKFV